MSQYGSEYVIPAAPGENIASVGEKVRRTSIEATPAAAGVIVIASLATMAVLRRLLRGVIL